MTRPAASEDEDHGTRQSAEVYLERIARDIRQIRLDVAKALNAIGEAESEVPEKVRRFTMYFHDVRDLVSMHEERGLVPPPYLLREIERCDDRFKHILQDQFGDGGTFERVRRDMTERGGNRYDHTRLIAGVHKETNE
jgi:hypothetical protein